MKGPKTIIMSGYGINCERETAYAFRRAGANPKVVHINELIDDKREVDDCNILVFPGGFSMGDDTGSGLAYANMVRDRLGDEIERFIERDTLAIGICNGFQIMTHLGMFPAGDTEYGTPKTALTFNSSARYRDLWVNIARASDNCMWAKGIETLFLPIAHGEGRFYATDKVMGSLKEFGQVVFRYSREDGTPASGSEENPNGSIDDVAAICDPTGRFLGMMPHPERAILSVQDALYTLKRELASREGKKIPEETDCMRIFRNAVEYFR